MPPTPSITIISTSSTSNPSSTSYSRSLWTSSTLLWAISTTDSHTHTAAIYLEKKCLIHPPLKWSKLEKIVHNEYSLNVNRIRVPPAKKKRKAKRCNSFTCKKSRKFLEDPCGMYSLEVGKDADVMSEIYIFWIWSIYIIVKSFIQ